MINFLHKEPRLRIAKAKKPRKPWKTTRTYSRLNALARTMEKPVRINFVKGITAFKKKVDLQVVYEAWLSKDYAKLYATIPWQDLPKEMDGYGDALGDVIEGVGLETITLLPAPVKDELRWDTSNPRIRDYITNRTGVLIQDITSDTQAFIAKTISKSFDQALTPRRVADLIRPQIGLGTRLGQAHSNYVDGLRAQNVSESRIVKLSDAYEEKLLDYRATMIARTETSFARNQGQLSVWQTAADQDLIDRRTALKQWIVDGDPCPECLDLEDQGPIGLEEMWDSDDGPLAAPPAHPNCLCGMEMNFEGGDEAAEPEEGADEEEPEEDLE